MSVVHFGVRMRAFLVKPARCLGLYFLGPRGLPVNRASAGVRRADTLGARASFCSQRHVSNTIRLACLPRLYRVAAPRCGHSERFCKGSEVTLGACRAA
jgi:hypothetical protein